MLEMNAVAVAATRARVSWPLVSLAVRYQRRACQATNDVSVVSGFAAKKLRSSALSRAAVARKSIIAQNGTARCGKDDSHFVGILFDGGMGSIMFSVRSRAGRCAELRFRCRVRGVNNATPRLESRG